MKELKEPNYRGAVIIDGEGRRWVRIITYSQRPWYRTVWRVGESPQATWSEIQSPKTLVDEERL